MRKVLLVLLGLCMPLGVVSAQTFGEITGEVRDQTGAVTPNVTVTATSVATNAVRSTATNEAGIYSFPALNPGFYSMKVESLGFQTLVKNNVELQVQQINRVDFTLAVGATTQTIEVNTSAQLLETQSATLGTVISGQTIVDLPLNGRDFLNLVALAPNVTSGFATPAQAVGRQGGTRAAQNISIAGMRGTWNNYTLDGVSNTDPNFNLYIQLPSLDMIQEFKVQSGIYPAEFGREAAQVNVSTKSGGNAFHGTAYEFLRNDLFDARDYDFSGKAPAKNPYRQNQFGFVLGGPVWIPKLFNGKNKLFFTSNYEAFRSRQTVNTLYTVPLPAWLTGDFSSLLTLATPIKIYDPFNLVGGVAQPFPGNIIPSYRFDQTAMKYLQYWPTQNVNNALTATGGVGNNYLNPQKTTVNKQQFTQRIDFNESATSQWFGRYSWTDENTITPSLPLSGATLFTNSRQYMISNTRVLSNSKVNEVRFGYTTLYNIIGQELGGVTNVDANLNLPVSLPNPASWGIPNIGNFAGGLSALGNSTNGPFVIDDKIIQVVDNFSWIHGKHSFRIGGEYRYDIYNQYGNEFARGAFQFNGQYSKGPGSASAATSTADFLLGALSRTDLAVALAATDFKSNSFAAYIDDTYKVTPKLTVTLGLRYEVVQPYKDSLGNEVNFWFPNGLLPAFAGGPIADPTQHPVLVRAGTGNFYDNVNFRYTNTQVARDGRLGDRLLKTPWNDFAPRIGIAWSPTNKWSIRTGFGVFFSQESGNSRFDLARTLSGRASNIATAGIVPPVTFQNFFSSAVLPVQLTPGLTWGIDPNLRTPYSMTYLLDVQRQIGNSASLEIGYNGMESRKLQNLINAAAPQPNGTGVAVALRSPYPEFASGIQYLVGSGNADYNALSVKYSQNYSHGLTSLVSYTWSRAYDVGSAIRGATGDQFAENSHCIPCEYGPSSFNTPQRLVASATYELPVGRGKSLGVSNGILDAVVGGWQLSGDYSIQSGRPLDPIGWDAAGQITQPDSNRLNYTGTADPNQSGSQRTVNNWFNKAAFAEPLPSATGAFGNAGRNSLVGPTTWNIDLSLMKNFRVKEGQTLQFRYETFNTPNHPEWGNPVVSWGGQGYNASPAGTFDKITTTAAFMRQMQFALKYIF